MNQEKNAKLSAVVICRNEEQNIVRCIQSLQLVTDDIVVVDSGSDDNTVLFAKVLGARVFERTWTGYSDQKNFGNNQALHPYIISIDADECISPELADSINEEMLAPSGSVYEFDFITSWEGKFVYHGSWYPDRHCRLFDKRKIVWDTQSVHEQLSMEGFTPHRLKGNIYHHTARDKEYYREKMTRYAQMFANSRHKEYRYSPVWKKYLSSSCRFMRDYIIRKGFLEGKAGLQIAVEETRYTFLKYKWSERRRRA